jgi:hypothetical protein
MLKERDVHGARICCNFLPVPTCVFATASLNIVMVNCTHRHNLKCSYEAHCMTCGVLNFCYEGKVMQSAIAS